MFCGVTDIRFSGNQTGFLACLSLHVVVWLGAPQTVKRSLGLSVGQYRSLLVGKDGWMDGGAARCDMHKWCSATSCDRSFQVWLRDI